MKWNGISPSVKAALWVQLWCEFSTSIETVQNLLVECIRVYFYSSLVFARDPSISFHGIWTDWLILVAHIYQLCSATVKMSWLKDNECPHWHSYVCSASETFYTQGWLERECRRKGERLLSDFLQASLTPVTNLTSQYQGVCCATECVCRLCFFFVELSDGFQQLSSKGFFFKQRKCVVFFC